MWLLGAGALWSVFLIVLACADHDRGSDSDPDQIFHSYTLVHSVGPGILLLVGAPLPISLALGPILHLKTTRRSFRAERTALWVAGLSLLWCLVDLIVQGVWAIPIPFLLLGAVATAPLAARDSLDRGT